MADRKTIVPITLEKPIKRGDTAIDTVNVRRPGPGELRGLKLSDLIQSDVDSLFVLLPRITVPPLTAHEVEQELDVSDLISMANEVAHFLRPMGSSASPTE